MPNARDRCEVVRTGVYMFKGGVSQEGTIYRCRWCKEELRLKVKGIFENLDDAGKKAHVDTLNEYHKRLQGEELRPLCDHHTCQRPSWLSEARTGGRRWQLRMEAHIHTRI